MSGKVMHCTKPKWDWDEARRLAEIHGRSPSTIVDCWRQGRPIGNSKIKTRLRSKEIDVHLAVMSLHVDVPMTRVEIAEVCGCTAESIRQIEVRAMIKLRGKAKEITDEWRQSA